MIKFKKMKLLFYVHIPVAFAILVYISTFVLFNQSKKDTIQILTENISNELDNAVFTAYKLNYTAKDNHLSEEQLIALESNIRSINEQKNAYAFLFNTEFEWDEDYLDIKTKPEKRTIEIVQALIENNFSDIIKTEDNQYVDDNYIHLTINNKKYTFYWRKVPPTNSEVYIIVGFCEDEVQPSQIVNVCRFLIGTMDISIVGCIYIIIYIYYERPKKIGGS